MGAQTAYLLRKKQAGAKMDETGLLLLFSSFPCALLLIMLTEMAEQRQAQPRAPAPAPVPAPPRGAVPLAQLLWDVRGFFAGREALRASRAAASPP